jgi:hypothetical protein
MQSVFNGVGRQRLQETSFASEVRSLPDGVCRAFAQGRIRRWR